MNIGNIKGLIGDAVSNDVRTLELKIGQVVRGVVLQHFNNNEALVNINGVQVRAKLEAPLMEGQASLMQVQPDSKGASIILRQVDPTAFGLNDPMKDILKAMSLPDKTWANEIVKDLRREGFPLNKETAAAFQKAAQLMPSGVSQEEWMQAAAAAFKRGLPLTQATVTAMQQLQSGIPLHGLMEQLKGQLSGLIQGNSTGQSTVSMMLLNQLFTMLDEGSSLMNALLNKGSSIASQGQSVSTMSQQLAASMTSNSSMQATNQASNGIVNEQLAQGPQQLNSSANATSNNGNNTIATLLKWLGVSHESVLGKQVLNGGSQATHYVANSKSVLAQGSMQGQVLGSYGTQPNQVQQSSNSLATQLINNQSSINQTVTTQASQASQASQVIFGANSQSASAMTMSSNAATGALANVPNESVGVNATGTNQGSIPAQGNQQQSSLQNNVVQAEQTSSSTQNNASLAQQINQQQGNHSQQQLHAQAPLSGLQTQSAVASQLNSLHLNNGENQFSPNAIASNVAAPANSQAESLKSLILQVVNNADTPQAIKETAQQLLSAITGQQLMLSTERNHSVFSHVTMYIPLQDKNGSQTATVHIQTRRDRKGELDSENCRIVFDLNMHELGPTLVDVNITNKIVSLNLWNDHPVIGNIVESMKPEISEALYETGYMLSSVRATPIPTPSDEEDQEFEAKRMMLPPDVDQINSTRYKGVDFKI